MYFFNFKALIKRSIFIKRTTRTIFKIYEFLCNDSAEFDFSVNSIIISYGNDEIKSNQNQDEK